MLYDCIYFFNEIDILLIRLKEIGDIVDKIILVEGNYTYSQRKKKSYYLEYKHIFEEYNHKILHYIVDMTPLINKNITNRWDYDYYQKNYILKILKDLNIDDDDDILISDIDEIPYKNMLTKGISILDNNFIILFHLIEIKYWLNSIPRNEFIGCFLLKYSKLKKYNDTQLEIRNKYCHHRTYDSVKKKNGVHVLKNSGLHLTTMGDFDCKKYKVQSFAHEEIDNIENTRLDNKIIYSPILKHNNEKYRNETNIYDWLTFNNVTKINKDTFNNIELSDELFDEIKNNRERYINLFLLYKV